MATPAAYRVNADGSLTITGFAHAVRIGPAEARYEQAFGPRGADGQWAGPVPVRCTACDAEASFHTRSEPRGQELVFLHYRCANCGDHYIEPFD